MKFYKIKNIQFYIYIFLGLFIIHSAFILKYRDNVKTYLELSQIKKDLSVHNNAIVNPIISDKQADLTANNEVILIIEIILLFIGIPFIVATALALNSYKKKLAAITNDIQEYNKTYVFNSLENNGNNADEEIVKSSLMANLKKALFFIKEVSGGNYEIQWEGLNETNKKENQVTIAGELIHMRDQMKNVKEDDKIRIWNTEGLSKFGEIIRKNQDDFTTLSEEIISKVVNYVGAQVGGLFILDKDENGDESLHLKASYAYDRKKYLSKKIEIGIGIVGQCFIEGQTIYIEEVPEDYVSITSGLGLANPTSLLVVPLKANDKIEGILELASLKVFLPHQIEFLEKLGELLASTISTERTGEKTNELLRISQKQAEDMRTQEEELRQNMEELQSIQENNNRTLEELARVTVTLEKEKYLLDSLLNNIPDSIYFKDVESKFICVSKYLANRLNYTQDFLTGKSDFDLFDKQHAQAAYDDEHKIMNTRQPKIDYVEQESADQWVSTTKMPLINSTGEVVGTFGISRDVSKFKNMERDLLAQETQYNDEKEQLMEKIKVLEENIQALQKKN